MIVGTAGHIDHGKTSLVRALTGVETDRLKEEKERGITIDLGFAYRDLGSGRRVGFVDVPGHERFVHTMLAGAGGIDVALLVVAADDGIMPQTREHLAILDLLGVSRGLVALTKTDLASPDRVAAVRDELAELLKGSSLEGIAIHPVSTVTGEGVEALRARLSDEAAAFPQRLHSGRFRLSVDRSFVLAGAGTVVTGTVLSGAVRVGDTVRIAPAGLAARVRSIHAQDRKAEEGVAGDRCALNLAGEGIERGAVHRGDMVLDSALHAPTDRIDASFRLLPSEKRAVGQWFPVRLHHAAAEVAARIVLLGEPVQPGARAHVQLVLERPIAAVSFDRFVLRDTSAQRTIGGGRFLDLRAPARRRRSPERLAQLAALDADSPREALAALLDTPPFHVDLDAFGRDHGLSEDELRRISGDLGLTRIDRGAGTTVMREGRWRAFRQDLLARLAEHHDEHPDLPGIGIERLRLGLATRLSASTFRGALATVRAEGAIVMDGAWVRLAGHEAKLSAADEALWRQVEPRLLGTERFRPPRTRDLAGELGVAEPDMRRILKSVGRMGLVHEIANDHFFPRPVVGEIVAILRDVAERAPGGDFTAADLRDRLDNGRKVAIQILEFLDRQGLTIRKGDLRRLNPHRLDLFGDHGSS